MKPEEKVGLGYVICFALLVAWMMAGFVEWLKGR